MTRISVEEFRYMVEHQDPSALVLIVEGVEDARFFTQLVPLSERTNATVVPIGEIDIPVVVEGGEKGKALWLAHHIEADSPAANRVFYFVDADLDRFLEIEYVQSVIPTDYSDLESYVITDCSLGHILFQFGQSCEEVQNLRQFLKRVCKEIKTARLCSVTCNLLLPINRTIEGRLSRYMSAKGTAGHLDVPRLINAMHANNASSLQERSLFGDRFEAVGGMALPAEHWFQGKDLIAAVAHAFAIGADEAHRVILGAIRACLDVIRAMPNMNRIDQILRS